MMPQLSMQKRVSQGAENALDSPPKSANFTVRDLTDKT
ncbi:hypothetical protein ACVWXL_005268 [Bradyrhizobium sp. GM22.5]